jgi:hypothetical protein
MPPTLPGKGFTICLSSAMTPWQTTRAILFHTCLLEPPSSQQWAFNQSGYIIVGVPLSNIYDDWDVVTIKPEHEWDN